MSSQKGNIKRTRPQRHQNRSVFKNNLHDTSKRTKEINNLDIAEVCKACKDVIEWKIKYKKYKPLTQPKTCLNCHSKSIKFAYHTLCGPCGKALGVCCKCRLTEELVQPRSALKTKEDILAEMEGELKLLSERKRRTFLRYLDKLYGAKKKKRTTTSEDEVNCIEDKKEEEAVVDPHLDYIEQVRRKLDQLGRQVMENEFGEDSFDNQDFDCDDCTDSDDS